MTSAVENIQLPTSDLETAIDTQLKTLTTDILQYLEKFLESQKVQESNDCLQQRLKAQEDQSTKLKESVDHTQKEKDNLQARVLELQCEVDEWKAQACKQTCDASQVENQMDCLRRQVKENEDKYNTTLDDWKRVDDELRDKTLELKILKVVNPRPRRN